MSRTQTRRQRQYFSVGRTQRGGAAAVAASPAPLKILQIKVTVPKTMSQKLVLPIVTFDGI